MIRTLLLASFVTLSAQAADNLKAHVHGVLELNVAVKEGGKELQLSLESPGESILGHEKAKLNKKEEADWKKVQDLWQNKMNTLVDVPGANCKVSEATLKRESESEEDEKDHGKKGHKHQETHVEISGEAKLLCETSVTGKDLIVKIKQVYPKVQKMVLTVVPEKGQPQMKTVTGVTETLKL